MRYLPAPVSSSTPAPLITGHADEHADESVAPGLNPAALLILLRNDLLTNKPPNHFPACRRGLFSSRMVIRSIVIGYFFERVEYLNCSHSLKATNSCPADVFSFLNLIYTLKNSPLTHSHSTLHPWAQLGLAGGEFPPFIF